MDESMQAGRLGLCIDEAQRVVEFMDCINRVDVAMDIVNHIAAKLVEKGLAHLFLPWIESKLLALGILRISVFSTVGQM